MSDYTVYIKRPITDVDIVRPRIALEIKSKIIRSSIPEYTGETTVSPVLSQSVVLNTTGKYISTDIQVRPIPWEEVDNLQGGRTVTIGGN